MFICAQVVYGCSQGLTGPVSSCDQGSCDPQIFTIWPFKKRFADRCTICPINRTPTPTLSLAGPSSSFSSSEGLIVPALYTLPFPLHSQYFVY